MSRQINTNLSDEEFMKQHAEILYRKTNSTYGGKSTTLAPEEIKGISGKFTNHLLAAEMYRNQSLNTVPDRERYMKSSKDWMDKLNA